MNTVVLVRYNEVALKGGNRELFEKQLVLNIKSSLKPYGIKLIERIFGRIQIQLPQKANIEAIKASLQRVFGIANFSLADQLVRNYDTLEEHILQTVTQRKFDTFGIRCRRSDKGFPMTSQEIAIKLGRTIVDRHGKSVDLNEPDLWIGIEIIAKNMFVFYEKISGPGGLPVGTSAKFISLLSGGIDSPVASWMMAKRGASNIFVHFHSYPQTSSRSQENVVELAKILRSWSAGTKLYKVPFLEIQKQIIASKADPKYRVLLYRRAMRAIAQMIAEKEGAKALVTGESLGQVASQTVENIHVVNIASELPIFRPLIGMDKQEIIKLAERIGTFEISTRPYEDCCSFFVPERPETKARLRDIEDAESKIEYGDAFAHAVERAEVVSL